MGRHSPRHGERIIAFRVMRPLQIEFFRSLLEGKHLPSCISALRAVPKRAWGKSIHDLLEADLSLLNRG
jgi:hypothetical protein